MRRRIGELEPGVYSFVSWSEWTEAHFKVPCTLTVEEDSLIFDFTEASDQTLHYINSKPFVVNSMVGVQLANVVGYDLPLNEGLFRTFEVKCRPGSILDAQPPAPIGAPHLDVGMTASEVAMHALNLAIAASPRSEVRKNMSGPSAGSAMALHILAGTGLHGGPDGFMLLESGYVGTSAGNDRDRRRHLFRGPRTARVGGIDRHRGPGILVPDARRVSAPAAWDGRRRQVPRGCRFLHGLSDRRVEGHGHHAAGQPGTGTDRRNVRRRSGSLDRVPHPSDGRGAGPPRMPSAERAGPGGREHPLRPGERWRVGRPSGQGSRARGGRCQGRQTDGSRCPRHLRCRRRGCGSDRAGQE